MKEIGKSKLNLAVEDMVMEKQTQKQKIRAFISLDIVSSHLRHAIPAIQQQLRGSDINLKFVDLDKLHLTLKFLGDVTPFQVKTLIEELEKISFSEFEIELRGLGCFPNPKKPRVVFIQIMKGKEEVIELSKKVDEVTLRSGFPPIDREVKPHLTIGRIKKYKKKKEIDYNPGTTFYQRFQEINKVNLGTFQVEGFFLKESILTPVGPIYTILDSFPLQKKLDQ
ncbi:MAG: RNA 2',3'-cyclic phosphodiesterase [Candidatus Ranarchaeia archaeon]